jgi:hypothetical protein
MLEPTHEAIVIAGASRAELSLLANFMAMHPQCSLLPRLEIDLTRRLADLASYVEAVRVKGDGGAGVSPQLGNTWERVLKIELGNAVIRSASKILLKKPGSVVVATVEGLGGLDEFFDFFPTTPLILLLGEGEKPRPVEMLTSSPAFKGHPATIVKVQDLRNNHVRTMNKLLDFVSLPAAKFRWQEFELAAALLQGMAATRATAPEARLPSATSQADG